MWWRPPTSVLTSFCVLTLVRKRHSSFFFFAYCSTVDFRDGSGLAVTFDTTDPFSGASQPLPVGSALSLKWKATRLGFNNTITSDSAPSGSKLMVAVASVRTEQMYYRQARRGYFGHP
jgi:hypothetical protein